MDMKDNGRMRTIKAIRDLMLTGWYKSSADELEETDLFRAILVRSSETQALSSLNHFIEVSYEYDMEISKGVWLVEILGVGVAEFDTIYEVIEYIIEE